MAYIARTFQKLILILSWLCWGPAVYIGGLHVTFATDSQTGFCHCLGEALTHGYRLIPCGYYCNFRVLWVRVLSPQFSNHLVVLGTFILVLIFSSPVTLERRHFKQPHLVIEFFDDRYLLFKESMAFSLSDRKPLNPRLIYTNFVWNWFIGSYQH
jgi:hypothetical protein